MQTLNLTGNWTLCSADGKLKLPAVVPGDNISALLAAKQIPDPYWADNEIRLQWIGRADWVYERQFQVSQAQFAEQSIFLNCDSLDTLATIFINDRRVTHSENMFVRLRVEVKPFLRVGRNTIRIVIASAEVGAADEARLLPYPIQHGNTEFQCTLELAPSLDAGHYERSLLADRTGDLSAGCFDQVPGLVATQRRQGPRDDQSLAGEGLGDNGSRLTLGPEDTAIA